MEMLNETDFDTKLIETVKNAGYKIIKNEPEIGRNGFVVLGSNGVTYYSENILEFCLVFELI